MIEPRPSLRVLLCLSVLSLLISSGTARSAQTPPGRHAAPAAVQVTAGPVDVNEASEEDLITVPGIGKSIAHRIVEFRDKNGPFQRVDDLLKVQGIGEKSLQKLRPHLTVGKAH